MDRLSTTTAVLTAPATSRAGTPQPLVTTDILDENTDAEADELFALLLGELTPAVPGDAVVVTIDTAPLAGTVVPDADQALPPSGNPLPLLPTTAASDDALPTLVAPATGTGHGPDPHPVPGLVQPTRAGDAWRRAPPPAPGRDETALHGKSIDSDAVLKRPAAQPAPVVAERAALPDIVEEIAAPPRQGPTVTVTAPANSPATGVALIQAPAVTAPAAATPQQHALTVHHPVNDARWGEELGHRLVWMHDKGIGHAQLRMNPAELGPVEVRISVSNDDARVAFHVQHAATRDAIENAVPRLREMFANQGLNLADASVSQQSPGDQRQPGQTDSGTRLAGPETDTETGSDLVGARHAATLAEGLIDTYA